MRVPPLLVILLVLAVIGGVWISNTRHVDFLNHPSQEELEKTRVQVASSLPQADHVDDAISAPPAPTPPPPPVEAPKPTLNPADLTNPITLRSYGSLSPKGPGYLVDLATLLEEKGEKQRALLAWERVIDATWANPKQTSIAHAAIHRLRPNVPNWNPKPELALLVTLHANTSKKFTKLLTPVLDEVARELERASSGIIKFKSIVTSGKTSVSADRDTPIALWFSGPDKKSPSTPVRTFISARDTDLRQGIEFVIYQLLRDHLGRIPNYARPGEVAAMADARIALHDFITRRGWNAFGTAMNPPPPPPPVATSTIPSTPTQSRSQSKTE